MSLTITLCAASPRRRSSFKIRVYPPPWPSSFARASYLGAYSLKIFSMRGCLMSLIRAMYAFLFSFVGDYRIDFKIIAQKGRLCNVMKKKQALRLQCLWLSLSCAKKNWKKPRFSLIRFQRCDICFNDKSFS